MITALVLFPMPVGTTRDQAAAIFRSTAPLYRGVEGLVRKYYVFDAEAGRAGGIYLWTSRAAAERAYDATWRARVTAKYGATPELRFFDTPVIVDNAEAAGVHLHDPHPDDAPAQRASAA